MSTIIRTIKIPLDAVYTENTDIGLYTSGGVSELRYTESPLTGVSTTYKEGLIIDIGAISHSADFRDGGAQVQVSDVEIILANAVNGEQFNYALKFAGINLIGLVVEIEEYVGIESDSDSVEVVNIFTGSIENITWNELEFKITAKSSLALRRNNYLCKKSGEIVTPCTFGESGPSRDVYFKAIRANDNVQILKLSDISSGGTAGINYFPERNSVFPVYQMGANNKIWQIILGYMDGTALPDADVFIGKYMHVVEGKGAGVYRRIVDASVIATGANSKVEVELSDYLTDDLVGSDVPVTDWSWVEFVSVDKEYIVDDSNCFGFCDSTGTILTNKAELFSEVSGSVVQISQFGYDVDTDNTDNNSLIINPTLFNNDLDTMYSFLFLPVYNFKRSTSSNLAEWSIVDRSRVVDGVYRSSSHNFSNIVVTPASTESAGNIFDKTLDTYCSIQSSFDAAHESADWEHAFTFELPELPDKTDIKGVYIGVRIKSVISCAFDTLSTDGNHTVNVKKRGYVDRLVDCGSAVIEIPSDTETTVYFDNIADFYINRNNGNIQFWTDGIDENNVGKYTLFDLDISNEVAYNSIYQLLLRLITPDTTSKTNCVNNTFLQELFIMVRSETNVKEVIYV